MENIGKVIMNYDYYSGTDLYSDGDVEDTLLEIVKTHDKRFRRSIPPPDGHRGKAPKDNGIPFPDSVDKASQIRSCASPFIH